MKKEIRCIFEALNTVFFQEGFDREEHKHGLKYWEVENDKLDVHCRQCKIWDDDGVEYLLNTVNMNGQWFLRVFNIIYDEDGCVDSINIELLIPVDTDRLCWEEMPICAQMIQERIFPDLEC